MHSYILVVEEWEYVIIPPWYVDKPTIRVTTIEVTNTPIPTWHRPVAIDVTRCTAPGAVIQAEAIVRTGDAEAIRNHGSGAITKAPRATESVFLESLHYPVAHSLSRGDSRDEMVGQSAGSGERPVNTELFSGAIRGHNLQPAVV